MSVPLNLSSVPNVEPFIQYIAAKGQTVYPYPFPVTQDVDLVVVINGFTLATGLGYTLTGEGTPTGGNVVLNTGSNAGDIITLYRDIAIERLTQIGQNSGFASTAFNAEYNNIYLILQQLNEQFNQTLKVPVDDYAPVTLLPPAAQRANKVLLFDANGNAFVGDSSSLATVAAFGTAVADVFVSTAGQTVFALSQTPGTQANVDLSVDGATLVPTVDYTVVGTVLTLLAGLKAGQTVLARYMQGLPTGISQAAPHYDQVQAEILAGVLPVNFTYPPLDIRRYGAVVGTVSDSTAATQTAINVAAAGGSTGGIVYLPQGTWKITSTLTIPAGSGVNIQGSGKLNTILYCVGFGSGQAAFNYAGTSISRIDAIFARGFAVQDATIGNVVGFNAAWVINSAFDDLYFYNCQYGWVSSNSFGIGFRNNNAFGITQNSYLLGVNSNNILFHKTRCAGIIGINVISDTDTLAVIGCDFEGILANGAAISLSPAAGRKVHGVSINCNHFENVNGTAIFAVGADPSSIVGLDIRANYITGGFSGYGNTQATNAIELVNVKGFDISQNEFEDWHTNAVFLNGSSGNALNGRLANNTSTTNAVAGLSDVAFDKSVQVANNWVGRAVNFTDENEVPLPYSASIAVDSSTGKFFDITVTNGTAFTVNNPTGGFSSKQMTIKIRNTSGGAMGSITWASSFKMSAWTNPANGFSRSISFTYDGANWIQVSQTGVDIPN